MNSRRGTGRTTRMLEEAKKVGSSVFIVAHTMWYAQRLARQAPGAIPVSAHDPERLIGNRNPIFIDHYVFEEEVTYRKRRKLYRILRDYLVRLEKTKMDIAE